jgi:hypothetical protein
MQNPEFDLTESEVSLTFNRLVQTDGNGSYFDGKGNSLPISTPLYYQVNQASNLIQTQKILAKYILESYGNDN